MTHDALLGLLGHSCCIFMCSHSLVRPVWHYGATSLGWRGGAEDKMSRSAMHCVTGVGGLGTAAYRPAMLNNPDAALAVNT
jgi:hypothetical protein